VNKGLVLALCAGVVIALSGCAADTAESVDAADAAALAEGCTPSGPAADALDISGEFGQSPVVTFDAPLDVESTQRSVVIEGSGVEVAAGDDVLIHFALYNATSGAKIEESGYTETSPTVLRIDPNAPVCVGLSLTVACTTVGSRVAGVIPASQAFGPDGAPEFGMEPGDGLLLIVDVVGIKPPPQRLEGEPLEPSEGFPRISYDDSGAPVVVIPEGEVPTEFALEALITGDGAVVTPDDVVVLEYHGVNWNTGEVFDSSWERGQPGIFPAGRVIAGFRDALLGQTVGSRVIVVIPAALGYGPIGGTEDGKIGAEDTIVFVVDILGVQ
jgi:peptidylprolyl isomerase